MHEIPSVTLAKASGSGGGAGQSVMLAPAPRHSRWRAVDVCLSQEPSLWAGSALSACLADGAGLLGPIPTFLTFRWL